VTPAQFRAVLPEFADSTRYPEAQLTFWLGVSESFVNARRWGALADLGIALCTAHHLVIAARDQADAARSGAPGHVKGPMASFSVDTVSTGYDTGAVTLAEAGFWNSTAYGVRYLTLARSMGAGGVQL
jgi:hypothetical protein